MKLLPRLSWSGWAFSGDTGDGEGRMFAIEWLGLVVEICVGRIVRPCEDPR